VNLKLSVVRAYFGYLKAAGDIVSLRRSGVGPNKTCADATPPKKNLIPQRAMVVVLRE
jgi:hypothetical protein